jgi:hypothetical protein
MSAKHSLIALSAAAFLVCSPAIVQAQAPADTPPAVQTDTRDGDFDLGWIGLLGLLGLAGLSGRKREDVVVRR